MMIYAYFDTAWWLSRGGSKLSTLNQMQRKKKKQAKTKRKYGIAAALVIALLAVGGWLYFLSGMPKGGQTAYLYIDEDDTADSVYNKLSAISKGTAFTGFKTLAGLSSYGSHVKTGRYEIGGGMGALTVWRHLKNGMQTPVRLTVPSVRTMEDLARELSRKLMLDSATIATALKDESVCEKYGYDTATITCLFIPNTYDVYWNTSLENFLTRMQRESQAFWKGRREEKAKQLGLSPVEVMTLASIVDEETAANAEKPMVAGMYYNRLTLRDGEYPEGMPLQADPTVKYAWKRFDLRRIWHNLLTIDSPYNTYKYAGLPPGPIRIPSVAGIDAVLDLKHHDYLYMCAKEDFSGRHNFARTYEEHLQNARKYSEALNQRGIK